MTQMCEVCNAVPDDFIVLSGDDALTLPLMAIGGRGIISVASNAIPREMSQMVERAERGRLRRRHAQLHRKLLPFMQINFIESNPGADQERDGVDGAARGGLQAADGAAGAGIEGANRGRAAVAQHAGAGRDAMIALETQIADLVAAGEHADRAAAREVFAALGAALGSGSVRAAEPDPSVACGWRVNAWVKQGILLGFRFGETVDVSADHGRWPFFDKDTLPLKRLRPADGVRIVPGGSSVRDGAYPRPRRDLHAADVRQHRRVRRR